MDRYVVREPRVGAECLQGNQIIAFPTSTAGNNMIPETYYGPYGTEFQNIRAERYPGVPQCYTQMTPGQQAQMMSGQHAQMMSSQQAQMMSGQQARMIPGQQAQLVSVQQAQMMKGQQAQMVSGQQTQMMPGQQAQMASGQQALMMPDQQAQMVSGRHAQMMSGIDPTYLSAYSRNSIPYTAGHQQMHREMQMERQMQFRADSFGADYQNRNFTPVDRNKCKTFGPKVVPCETPRHFEIETRPSPKINSNEYNKMKLQISVKSPASAHATIIPPKSQNETELQRNELQSQTLTRSDKLKALAKTGVRVFSGPVEKVLKWHKAVQDIGVLILFEIVAKCVSIRPGDTCSKKLVVRDDNGPAIQVVYYEIDFLLPDLKPPCTIRVVGRMMPGTCRLQAFSVRPAAGDDVATLPRRAAVANHHVAKLCKEYGTVENN